jgi:hypothetical protein
MLPDVTKSQGSKAFLSLQEGEGEMLRLATKKVMWVGSDRRER